MALIGIGSENIASFRATLSIFSKFDRLNEYVTTSLLVCHLSAENYLLILVIHAFRSNLEIESQRERMTFDKGHISYTNITLSNNDH
jgi:hypothetical protein